MLGVQRAATVSAITVLVAIYAYVAVISRGLLLVFPPFLLLIYAAWAAWRERPY